MLTPNPPPPAGPGQRARWTARFAAAVSYTHLDVYKRQA